jgi:hypothetical protein
MNRFQLPLLATLFALCAPVGAAPFPAFSVVTRGTEPNRVAELCHGGKVILRWRAQTGQDPAQVLAPVAERLNRSAPNGLTPSDFTSRAASQTSGRAKAKDAVVLLQGSVLLTVDAKQAALARSEAGGLAALWARRLGALFEKPYVMIRQASVDVPLQERREVELAGRPGTEVQVTVADPNIAQAALGNGGRLVVTGLAVGDTSVTVRAGDWDALVRAVVRKWAARVPEPIGLQITGDAALIPWLPRMVRLATRVAVCPEPGARVALREASIGGPRTLVISARGEGYFSLERTVRVELWPRTWAPEPPALAVLSNDPERVVAPQSLMRYRMAPAQPINLMWHHVNGAGERLGIVLRLANAGTVPAAVHVVGAEGGPSADELYVGHIAMQRFFAAWRAGSGGLLEIPARSICELSRVVLSPGQVVSGMCALTLVQGSGVFAEVVALDSDDAKEELAPAPANLTPTSPTRHLELPGHKPLQVVHEVGRGWGFVRIGRTAEDVTLHPRLRGEYAVLQDVEVQFRNPQRLRARLEIALRSGGGPARAVVDVNGQMVETGLLGEGDEYILYKERLDAEAKTVRVRLIPQGGSNYPLTLTARSFAD